MAGEIYFRHGRTGKTLYFTVTSQAETIWNGTALAAFLTANWTSYDIPLVESPAGSYRYIGDFPALLAASGTYVIEVYERQGVSPAITDPRVGIDPAYVVGAGTGSFTTPEGYPTEGQLLAFLQGAGLIDDPPTSAQSQIDLALAVSAAAELFEKDTGWEPFMAAEDPSTRFFDVPEGCLLDFRGGLVSAPTIEASGTELTRNEQYVLKPDNSEAKNRPWTYAKLRYRMGGLPQSIEVTGPWGRVPNGQMPTDAFQAVLQGAAADVAPQLLLLRTGGAEKVKQDTIEYSFSTSANGGTGPANPALWRAFRDRVVAKYKRLEMA